MDQKKPPETRKHQRFQVRDGAFVAPRARTRKLWQIIDISKGGLSFRYVAHGDKPSGCFELDIVTRDVSFSLEKIPARSVSDCKMVNHPPSRHAMRRCSVAFGDLTTRQKSLLEQFIRDHTEQGGSENEEGK
jgi:c-di-GMP-binding flagellar brake protein YcgR